MFMVTDKKKRIFAIALSAVLGITSVVSYNGFRKNATADDTDTVGKVTFAEGEGTGRDFSTDSWTFAGKLKNGGGSVPAEHAAKIVKDKDDGNYLKDDSTVIRLIRDVKAADQTSGMEGAGSYSEYRSGEAFLSKGIMMDTKAKFSVKFTFSMPEAVVNTTQTGGAQYAREVGGDGISFVMTTNSTHDVQAGSGIGYQGIDKSIAVELDSYFNGAYCMMDTGDFAYQNWGFDNQLYFHAGATPDGGSTYGNANPYKAGYENYVNPNNDERFDHVAIVSDGNVKKHEAISYINNLDPTELNADNWYKHLANRYNPGGKVRDTGSADASKESTCATRFADKGVNDRLFTVWIDYDGSKMDVSYANGKFSTAVKPEKPQISKVVDLSKFDGKKVYMGFTSAIGSSKANHTIHSFQFSNRYDASYKLNYYLKNKTTGEYELKKSTDVFTDEVGAKVTAENADKNYKTAFDSEGYTYSTVKTQETSATLTEAGKTYEMNVYYDPALTEENTAYRLNYYLKDKVTGKYVLNKTSDTVIGKVGTDVTAADVDKDYEKAYEKENYLFSKDHKQETTVKLEKTGMVYDMNVYYDPEEAYYKLNYYVYDEGKKDYVLKDTTSKSTGYVGSEYKITDVDPNYGTKYPNYVVNDKKQDKFSVKLSEAGKTYEMNVYYNPEEAGYRLNYYKLNPNTERYEYVESTTVIEGTVGTTYKVTDADADYEIKYKKDDYVINKAKNQTYSVTILKPNQTYEMDAYYDPVQTTYKTEYYLKQPDGSYKLKDTVNGDKTYAGKNVTAPGKTYEGYTHVITSNSVEQAVVKADGSTTMKVYYDPENEIDPAPVSPTYKIEYYVEEKGTYKLYSEKKDIPGKTGEEVTPEIIKIDGYTHTTTDKTNEKDTVRADSSTVLKVYYNKDTTPVIVPTEAPTQVPTVQPTAAAPTEAPTVQPTAAVPTEAPTIQPTAAPTQKPTVKPTEKVKATVKPTVKPTAKPTVSPEDLSDENPGAPNKAEKKKTKKVTIVEETPDTGDHNNMGIYVVLGLSSLAVLAGGLLTRKRVRK